MEARECEVASTPAPVRKCTAATSSVGLKPQRSTAYPYGSLQPITDESHSASLPYEVRPPYLIHRYRV